MLYEVITGVYDQADPIVIPGAPILRDQNVARHAEPHDEGEGYE